MLSIVGLNFSVDISTQNVFPMFLIPWASHVLTANDSSFELTEKCFKFFLDVDKKHYHMRLIHSI